MTEFTNYEFEGNEMLVYVINVDCLSDIVASQYGIETIRAIFARYGASSIENLTPSKICEVYADLYQLYNDN